MYSVLTKKWPIFVIVLLIMAIGAAWVFFPPSSKREYSKAKKTYNTYCGSCHVVPDPTKIPKSIWKNGVLPEMAARMGHGNIDRNRHPYPEKSMIDSATWSEIQDYVLKLAPDSVPNSPPRKGRAAKLSQFNSSLKTLDNPKTAGAIAAINFDPNVDGLFIGDAYGRMREGENHFLTKKPFKSPIVSSDLKEDTLYLTEIGIMKPSETARGVIYRMNHDTLTPLYEKLHRPVYSEISDLNEDGKNEIIVCEFGDYTGELSMLVKRGPSYEKKTLLALPGSIKVEIVDMDQDGKKDIVVLFSQGKEGIYIFYQKDNLQFEVEQVISLPPEYGSSWFSLMDYNKDGKLDIVLANGDNADYSRFLKPYHGVRLFINEGRDTFAQKWFYPINGATRVLAEDFDLDGDMDFAVSSFFPDFDNCPEEGFVYLENKNSANYSFEPQVTQKAKDGNWLVMDKGDFDKDGDIDLILGSFSLMTSSKLEAESTYDVLYLENNAVKK